jgi:hypothetical protein
MNETFYIYLIPVVNIPQTFTIDLGGTTYTLTVKWNDIAQSWFADIADESQNPLACGIPLICGADLLQQLAYLGIPGSVYVYTNGQAYAVPTLDNLGTECNLYFQTTVANNGG